MAAVSIGSKARWRLDNATVKDARDIGEAARLIADGHLADAAYHHRKRLKPAGEIAAALAGWTRPELEATPDTPCRLCAAGFSCLGGAAHSPRLPARPGTRRAAVASRSGLDRQRLRAVAGKTCSTWPNGRRVEPVCPIERHWQPVPVRQDQAAGASSLMRSLMSVTMLGRTRSSSWAVVQVLDGAANDFRLVFVAGFPIAAGNQGAALESFHLSLLWFLASSIVKQTRMAKTCR